MADNPESSDPISSPRRLASLAATKLMNTEKDEAFDRLTRLASNVIGVPIAAMTLLDAERQFIKSGVGTGDARDTPLAQSFCQHAVRAGAPFIVEDVREHELVRATNAGVLAYAGIPISVDEGEMLGAFCVADRKPRKWTDREIGILKDLSAAVEAQITAHRTALEVETRRQLLETVIHAMGSGLVVVDAYRRITIINADARQMIDDEGLTAPAEERAAKLGLYTPDGHRHLGPDELPLMRAARGEPVTDFEMMIRPPSRPGTKFCITASARPLPGGGGVMIMHDTSEQKEAERKARLNEALYHKLAGNIPNALIYLVDTRLNVLLAEGLLFNTLQMKPSDLTGRNLAEISAPENWPQTKAALETSFAGKTARFTSSREGRTFEAHSEPVYEGTEVVAAIAIYFDVTEREREADDLRTLTARLTALLEHMSEGVLFEDDNHRVQIVNRAALEMFGVRNADRILGADITAPASVSKPSARDTFAEPALAAFAIDEKRRLGERVLAERIELADGRVIERDFLPVVDGGVHRGNLWMHRDVTDRERTAQRLSDLSVRDELTSLFNRRGFIARGKQILDAAERERRAPILFFVDLNGMKPINDQMGHHEGDRALVDTARLLERAIPRALVARLGGDEFVALVGDPDGRTPASYERDLKDTIARFNEGLTRLYRISVSVGHTEFAPENPRTVEQLLNAADAQMYAAKRARQARGNVSLPPPTSTRS